MFYCVSKITKLAEKIPCSRLDPRNPKIWEKFSVVALHIDGACVKIADKCRLTMTRPAHLLHGCDMSVNVSTAYVAETELS